jgi:hypothetical protein
MENNKMISKKTQISPISDFLFFNNLFGVVALVYGVGIFYGYGRLIEQSHWVGFFNIVTGIIFFFIGYKIKLEVSLSLVFISVVLTTIEVIWQASLFGYFTPLPYLPGLFLLSRSYRVYRLMKNNKFNNVESTNPN